MSVWTPLSEAAYFRGPGCPLPALDLTLRSTREVHEVSLSFSPCVLVFSLLEELWGTWTEQLYPEIWATGAEALSSAPRRLLPALRAWAYHNPLRL